MAKSFTYIDKSGNEKTMSAESADAALSSSPDRASNSGVREVFDTPASTPSPTGQTPTEPTKPDRSGVVDIYEQSKKLLADKEKQRKKAKREADMFAAEARQARIDAINQSFAPRIAREVKAGDDRMQRVKALNFNKGIIGTGADTTKLGEQDKLNKGALEGIEDEKAVLINEAFGYADKLGKEYYETRSKELADDAEAATTLYKEQYDNAVKSLELFGKGGVTIDDLKSKDPQTYQSLVDSGMSDFQISGVLTQNDPRITAKLDYKDGVVTQYYIDPTTKQAKVITERVEGIPENYKAQFAPDGTLLFLPDRFDPKKPFSEQVIAGGNYRKPTAPKNTSIDYTADDKRKLQAAGLSDTSDDVKAVFIEGADAKFQKYLVNKYKGAAPEGYSMEDLEKDAEEYELEGEL